MVPTVFRSGLTVRLEHKPRHGPSGLGEVLQLTSTREADHLLQEIETLRSRLSSLSEASRRVSENLDLQIVLQEVIDNARYLTGARYGALLTYEPSGAIQDFITSGLSAEEIEGLKTLPQGLGLLGFMNEMREPLRLADIASHPSSVGFPENHPPMKAFLGMPIRHHGEHVGNIYLTEKEGGSEFMSEDQEILVMFASQAGAAILNARRYRHEQQARADLNALVNISPVGVLVFDGKTGNLVSANDEVRRMVGSLNAPGRSLNDLLQVMALRRADGSDIPVEELPPVKALARGETVVADKVVIHLPDGRAITTLVNARPIRREDGDIMSVVATIQDVTQLEGIKRQREEFLSNVSHKLRTPLSTIKGSTTTLLSSNYPLDPGETRQFLRVIDEQADYMRHLINDLVDMTQMEIGALQVNAEPTDVADLLDEAREAYIHTGAASNGVELDLPPTLPLVMADRRRILQLLGNLLASASGHPSKSYELRISASLRDVYLVVTVERKGSGATTLHPSHKIRSLSMALDEVAEMRNGRGDPRFAICEGIVEAHGGRLSVKGSENGRGIVFAFTIPVAAEAAHPPGQRPLGPGSALDPGEKRARILVVSGSREAVRNFRNTLSQAGFTTVAKEDPDEVERLIATEQPDIILLEQTLPGDDGFELLRRAASISDAPIIFVAGHEWDQQIGRAFELGAFDYISKPFTQSELLARVNVAVARGSDTWKAPSGIYLHGDLTINYGEREVSVSGCPVDLTATEYDLLTELSIVAGRVLTHEQLLRRVWGPLHSGDPQILRTYIKELRRKLGDDAVRPTYIFTEYGVGYRMARQSTSY